MVKKISFKKENRAGLYISSIVIVLVVISLGINYYSPQGPFLSPGVTVDASQCSPKMGHVGVITFKGTDGTDIIEQTQNGNDASWIKFTSGGVTKICICPNNLIEADLGGGSDKVNLDSCQTSTSVNLGEGDDEFRHFTIRDVVDRVLGEGGHDSIFTGRGNDFIDGGGDDDSVLQGGAGNDEIHGGDGKDNLDGGAGNDKLYGEDKDDTLNGGNNDDKLYGGDGEDHLEGGPGNDKLYGEDKDDTLSGGDGNDKLYGGDGNDVMKGEKDDDHLCGQGDDDTMDGNSGADTLGGGDGDDTMDAGGNSGDAAEGHDNIGVQDKDTADGCDPAHYEWCETDFYPEGVHDHICIGEDDPDAPTPTPTPNPTPTPTPSGGSNPTPTPNPIPSPSSSRSVRL